MGLRMKHYFAYKFRQSHFLLFVSPSHPQLASQAVFHNVFHARATSFPFFRFSFFFIKNRGKEKEEERRNETNMKSICEKSSHAFFAINSLSLVHIHERISMRWWTGESSKATLFFFAFLFSLSHTHFYSCFLLPSPSFCNLLVAERFLSYFCVCAIRYIISINVIWLEKRLLNRGERRETTRQINEYIKMV